jgi:hypothetical protein
MRNRRFPVLFGVAALAAGLAGCSGSGPYDVSGAVTFQGKPVPVGLVIIEPDSGRGNVGVQTQGLVREGQYRTLPGLGAISGPVIVTVNANDGIPKPMWPQGKLLFRTYQFKAELPAHSSTLNIEVPADLAFEQREEVQ